MKHCQCVYHDSVSTEIFRYIGAPALWNGHLFIGCLKFYSVSETKMAETFSEEDVVSALMKLSEATEANERRIQSNTQDLSRPTSDEEKDRAAPVFTSSVEHGTLQTLKNLKNFTKSEILDIRNAVKKKIEAEVSCGRERRSQTHPLDQFFTML